MQAWGLIVLLLSKAAGHHNVSEMEEDKAAGVLHRHVFGFFFLLNDLEDTTLHFRSIIPVYHLTVSGL